MRLEFKEQAFEDLQFWVQMNPRLAKRLLRLIGDGLRQANGQRCLPSSVCSADARFSIFINQDESMLSSCLEHNPEHNPESP